MVGVFLCRHGPLTGLARSGGLAFFFIYLELAGFIWELAGFIWSCAPDEGIGPTIFWRGLFGRARPMRVSGRHCWVLFLFVDLDFFWGRVICCARTMRKKTGTLVGVHELLVVSSLALLNHRLKALMPRHFFDPYMSFITAKSIIITSDFEIYFETKIALSYLSGCKSSRLHPMVSCDGLQPTA